MKIRNGFVSNSSSSSFCLIGYSHRDLGMTFSELSDKYDEFEDNDGNCSVICCGEEGEAFVGHLLINGEGIGSETYKPEEIAESLKKLKIKLNTDKEPKIYGGEYAN